LSIDIEATYLRYGPLVYRRCLRILGTTALAEDAMHDVFVRMVAGQSRLDERAILGLLYQTATHICLNKLRTIKRKAECSDDLLLKHIADLDDIDDRSAAKVLLDRLFRREPPSSRVIATLHFVDGMTLEEVANEVGMSVSGVRKRLRGLRDHLERLTKAPYDQTE
jgi:RNA polymerase sigma factor (sigma-70 family)